MNTERIASYNPLTAKGREMVMVTTVTGNVVWVPKARWNESAETISYEPMKKGATVTARADSTRLNAEQQPIYRKGDQITLTADRNEFKGVGKQIVEKFSAIQVLDHLINKGITPSFSLATA